MALDALSIYTHRDEMPSAGDAVIDDHYRMSKYFFLFLSAFSTFTRVQCTLPIVRMVAWLLGYFHSLALFVNFIRECALVFSRHTI